MRHKNKNYTKEISNRILDGYNSIYLLDLKAESMTPHIYNSDVAKQMLDKIGVNKHYQILIDEFKGEYVLPEERKFFSEKTKLSNVIFELERFGHFFYIFRRYNTLGIPEYVEMYITNIGDTEHAIVCFRTVSDDVNQIQLSLYNSNIPAEDLEDSLGKRTILIVEDNDVNLDVLKGIIKDHYNIITAHNGREGVQKLRKHYRRLSAILLDIYMPIMNGYDFLEIVSNDKMLAQIPIIVTTSNDEPDEEQKCLNLGAVDFIGKPFQPGLVLARIKNVIRLRESAATLSAMEYDSLTGLYTRQAFIHHAEKILHTNPDNEYNLIAIDLENYKLTNSQYGERRSDEFLSYFGEQVRMIFPSGMTGRFGGDLFIVLTKYADGITGEQINSSIKKILRKAPIPHQIAKIGIYEKIDKEMSVVASCDHVFLSIKRIKGAYKENVIYYTDEMREKLIEEQYIQECMDEALEKEQFQVYYQPKHDCVTEKVIGAEALVRWTHPKYGFMSPGQFIPLFERNGFITKLDSYVIRKVCEDMKEWIDAGNTPIPISVNASRRDFFEKGWLDEQLLTINANGITPGLLHMEVTESLYVENADTIIEQVKKIQGFGHMIEMDDFGSGYSSLGMLADFPLDVVKLDISFVRRIEINEVVIEAIINLAHKMGFKVVAEGVETEKQYKILKGLGCDYIQGYYFSKPLCKADFEKYLLGCHEAENIADQLFDSPTKWPVLTQELEIKNTLLECVNTLSTNATEQKKISTLLSIIAKFYGSDHSYIIEYDRKSQKINNTFEWNPDGVTPDENILLCINNDLVENWIVAIESGKEYFISETLVVVPLRSEGEIVGFVGVDSPIAHIDSFILMQSISSFIMNELQRGRYVSILEDMSYTDSLTGLANRNAFYRDITEIEKNNPNTRVGIVFADINGLKGQNDKGGHEAGDYLIKCVAEILATEFAESQIYRIGGDEFVILDIGVGQEEFQVKVCELEKKWTKEHSASVGSIWLHRAHNIEKNVASADKIMYQAKTDFYKEKRHDRRRATDGESEGIKLLQNMMENVPGGFFMYKADKTERIISVNKELIKLLKCTDKDDFYNFTGGTFEGLVHPDDYERVTAEISKQIDSDNDTDYVEYRIVCKDGEVKHVKDYGRFSRSALYGEIFYVFVVEKK